MYNLKHVYLQRATWPAASHSGNHGRAGEEVDEEEEEEEEGDGDGDGDGDGLEGKEQEAERKNDGDDDDDDDDEDDDDHLLQLVGLAERRRQTVVELGGRTPQQLRQIHWYAYSKVAAGSTLATSSSSSSSSSSSHSSSSVFPSPSQVEQMLL